MGGFFSSQGGSILGSILGKVANVANPYAGAVVGGVFEGLKASEEAKAAKKLAKQQIQASLGLTPAKKGKAAPMAAAKPLAPPPTSSVAMEKRTNPSGSTIATGLVSQAVPKLPSLQDLTLAKPIAPMVNAAVQKVSAKADPFYAMTAKTGGLTKQVMLEAPLTKGPTMANGYTTALARRLAPGGYTRAELARLGVTDLPRTSFSRLYYGPQGEFLQFRRARRMNACNPKALSRAFRRVEAFGRVAKRYWHFAKHSGAKIKTSSRKRR